MATTSTPISTATAAPTVVTTLIRGVLGGIAGGMVFGMLMQMMGIMPMIAKLVGSESVIVGWLAHLAISAFIGASFTVLLGRRVTSTRSGLLYGIGYGMLWWVLGALILMPAKLGMPIFQLNTTALLSLMGHMIFGAILGLVVVLLGRKR